MKKLLLTITILLFSISRAYAVGWDVDAPAGTDSASDIDSLIGVNNSALDLLLAGYRQNAQMVYLSSSTLTVNAGEVVVTNSGGTVRLMLRNTSTTTVSWANADCGEVPSATFYIYAYCTATTDTTFSIKLSNSSTTPLGVIYYKRLGSFYNDSAGNITLINNDDDLGEFGDWTAKSTNTSYQAFTDGFFIVYGSLSGSGYIYSDAVSNPATKRGAIDAVAAISSAMVPVKKGDYYKFTLLDGSATVWWVPLQ